MTWVLRVIRLRQEARLLQQENLKWMILIPNLILSWHSIITWRVKVISFHVLWDCLLQNILIQVSLIRCLSMVRLVAVRHIWSMPLVLRLSRCIRKSACSMWVPVSFRRNIQMLFCTIQAMISSISISLSICWSLMIFRIGQARQRHWIRFSISSIISSVMVSASYWQVTVLR